jgi:hypothetical protein
MIYLLRHKWLICRDPDRTREPNLCQQFRTKKFFEAVGRLLRALKGLRNHVMIIDWFTMTFVLNSLKKSIVRGKRETWFWNLWWFMECHDIQETYVRCWSAKKANCHLTSSASSAPFLHFNLMHWYVSKLRQISSVQGPAFWAINASIWKWGWSELI